MKKLMTILSVLTLLVSMSSFAGTGAVDAGGALGTVNHGGVICDDDGKTPDLTIEGDIKEDNLGTGSGTQTNS